MGPLYFFAYKLGAWLMDTPPMVTEVHIDFAWIRQEFDRIWWPLVLGSLVCGWVSGVTALAIVRVGWRMRVARQWRERARERRARATANAPSQER